MSSDEVKKPGPAFPPELEVQARADWEAATRTEKALAATLYERLIARPGRRSAVSGADLPPLESCFPLVRAGWLDVARYVGALLQAAHPVDAPVEELLAQALRADSTLWKPAS